VYLSPAGGDACTDGNLHLFAFAQIPMYSMLDGYQLFPHWDGNRRGQLRVLTLDHEVSNFTATRPRTPAAQRAAKALPACSLAGFGSLLAARNRPTTCGSDSPRPRRYAGDTWMASACLRRS